MIEFSGKKLDYDNIGISENTQSELPTFTVEVKYTISVE